MPANDEAIARPVKDPRAGDRSVLRQCVDVLGWGFAGLLVLREMEQRLRIAKPLPACIHDPRAPERIVHGLDEIIRFAC